MLIAPQGHVPLPAYRPQDAQPQPGRALQYHIYFVLGPLSAALRPLPPELSGRPAHGRRRLHPFVASALAPQGRLRPFPADYGPYPCRNGRTGIGPGSVARVPPPDGRSPGQDALPKVRNAHRPCQGLRIRDKNRAIAPAPRSCHTGSKWCSAAGCGETGVISSGLVGGSCGSPRYVNVLPVARTK